METFSKIFVVAIGGAFGAVARYLLNQVFGGFLAPFPAATFLINVTGSLLIGFLLTLATDKAVISENMRLALVVGFLGAYTTFSTFEFEIFTLFREKNFLTAFAYLLLSIIIGFIGVCCGVWLAKRFLS